MFVIVAYDVNKKRNKKIHQLCRCYLYAVEESVFEGMITDAKLKCLKKEIKEILVPDEDACIIYEMNSTRYCVKGCFATVSNQINPVISSEKSGR